MSCFIVPDGHVSALVAFAIRQGVVFEELPAVVAQRFADANRAAYSERYNSRYDFEVAPYRGLDRSADAGITPVAIVKACDCLSYQASDWPEWDNSIAARHLRAIRRVAAALADPYNSARDTCQELFGYERAAWVLEGVPA
jgi:hypothetical protein